MKCPICNTEIGASIRSKYFPHFSTCPVCTGHFAMDARAVEYPDVYFNRAGERSFFARVFSPFMSLFFRLRLGVITSAIRATPHAKVLDYGCGTGALVARLRREGFDALGYEPSPAAVAEAVAHSIPVFSALSEGRFDLIMFWHSLEHVDHPFNVITSLKEHLNPYGKLLAAIPNGGSWEAKLAGDRWFHYDYPFHRMQYTPISLEKLFHAAGFRIQRMNFFNPDYTIAGLVQTFLNFFLPKNALYSVLTHRRANFGSLAAIGIFTAAVLLVVIFSPLLILFYLAALITKNTGAIIVVAERI